jgi:dissimilatory sulfite reductase (desulfoviridin) alpha/beta subunit
VDSQEELTRYEGQLNKETNKWLEYYWSTRKFIFLARWAAYYQAFQFHFRFGFEFKFWLPGLEVKYACEAAEKVGANLKFLGTEMNEITTERLYHETRM